MGAAIGPVAGALAIGAGAGYRAPLWVSALLVALAFAVAGVAGVAGVATAARRRSAGERGDQAPAPTT